MENFGTDTETILVDNGNGEPFDILAMDDNGQIVLDDESLDNSASSDPPEKQDSGIEDKDSHPNSPATAKYALNGTMTCDVREKIVKNRAVAKTVEQIRSERQNANKRKQVNRGNPKSNIANTTRPVKAGGPSNRKAPTPQYEKQRQANRGQPSNRCGIPRSRGQNTNWVKKPISIGLSKFDPNRPLHLPAASTQPQLNESMNRSMIRAWGTPTGTKWNLNTTFTSIVASTHTIKTQFENLKVTFKKGKKGWWRKVECPTLQKKREASKELMNLIKGSPTQRTSTPADKENASKHIMAILHGGDNTSRPRTFALQPSSQPLQDNIIIPSTLNTTWQEFKSDNNVARALRVPQTLNQTWKNLDIDLNHDTILSEVPDEECGEEDSIATTVKSCILAPSHVLVPEIAQLQIN